MNSEKPPVVATWLLQHLGSSPNNEAVIGDLEERYVNHAPLWYWTQVFRTIGASWLGGIASNWLSTLGALGISWIHLAALRQVSRYLAGGAANPLTAYSFTHLLPYDWWGHNAVFWPVDWVLTWTPLFLISLFTGWILARLPRRHARAMVLTGALFTCLAMAAPTYRMLLGVSTIPPFYSVRGLFVPFQTLFGILLGGGMLISPSGAGNREKA
jgi:hypothetical protein